MACVIYAAFSRSGVSVGFAPIEFDYGVDFRISDITKDKTGAFAASIGIRVPDKTSWKTTSCTVKVDENRFHHESPEGARMNLIAGTGTCASPATSDGDAGATGVTIAPFGFRFLTYWPRSVRSARRVAPRSRGPARRARRDRES